MLLYIIRHGKPDYAADALTDEGRQQAKLVAHRLAAGGIDEIHSSPMGRAVETARPTAEKLGLPIAIESWAYELGSDSKTCFPDGREKTISSLPPEYFHQAAFRSLDSDEAIRRIPGIAETAFAAHWEMLKAGVDGMLEKLGYRRNDDGTYDVISPNDRHAALFCHAGMQRALLAHVLNIPFQLLAATVMSHYTGVTILEFYGDGPRTSPQLLSFADTGHLYLDRSTPLCHYFHKTPF